MEIYRSIQYLGHGVFKNQSPFSTVPNIRVIVIVIVYSQVYRRDHNCWKCPYLDLCSFCMVRVMWKCWLDMRVQGVIHMF